MQGQPNPYSPPQHPPQQGYPQQGYPQQGYPQQAAVDLPRMLRIAKNQRAIMLCILAQIAVASVGFFVPIPALVLGGLSLVVGIASIVFTVTLARVLYSMAGVIICIAMLLIPFAAMFLSPEASEVMPLVSLLTLLVVNQRATKELKGAGFKVGLLGGDPADVEAHMRAAAR